MIQIFINFWIPINTIENISHDGKNFKIQFFDLQDKKYKWYVVEREFEENIKTLIKENKV